MRWLPATDRSTKVSSSIGTPSSRRAVHAHRQRIVGQVGARPAEPLPSHSRSSLISGCATAAPSIVRLQHAMLTRQRKRIGRFAPVQRAGDGVAAWCQTQPGSIADARDDCGCAIADANVVGPLVGAAGQSHVGVAQTASTSIEKRSAGFRQIEIQCAHPHARPDRGIVEIAADNSIRDGDPSTQPRHGSSTAGMFGSAARAIGNMPRARTDARTAMVSVRKSSNAFRSDSCTTARRKARRFLHFEWPSMSKAMGPARYHPALSGE